MPIAGIVLLSACADPVIHSQLVKSGATMQEARQDLASCKYEAQKSAGRPPMDESLLSLDAWNVHRSQTASLCLQAKGYDVRLNLPGPCQGQCIGATALISR